MKESIWIFVKSILVAVIMSCIALFLSGMFPSEQSAIMYICGFIGAECVFWKKITRE